MASRLCIGFILNLLVLSVYAAPPTDSATLKGYEDEISALAKIVLENPDKQVRLASSQQLGESLLEALEKDETLSYSFENMEGISKLDAPDKQFRVFTWQVYVDKENYQYEGILQTKDGKIFPLEDHSADIHAPEFSRLKPSNWYGALYYGMKPFQAEGKTMYLLFGYDAFSFFNKRKVIEVLYFDHEGKPKFGKKVIQVKNHYGQPVDVFRYVIEYSASVSVGLKYSEKDGMVVYDHLIQTSPVPGQGPSNVPDGSYSGLEYKGEKWVYVDKVHEDIPGNTLIEAETPEETIKHYSKNSKKEKKNNRDIFGRRGR